MPDSNIKTIETKMGKSVEIKISSIVKVIDGIVGFPDLTEYALIPHGDESPFLWLQSVEEKDLAFITIDPRIFFEGYAPKILESELAAIKLEKVEDAIIQAIVVIPENPQNMTANLLAPIIINASAHLAKQTISQTSEHQIRHKMIPDADLDKASGEAGT